MSTNAPHGWSRRSARRLRMIRIRAAACRRRVRRAVTLGLVAAGVAFCPELVHAQMGQTAMAPTGGVVNRAVAGLQGLNQNGPGILYYGINAADRGLGYRGSYMTLGGFIPGFEDDLGGFWAADLRGHLSEYGGFFSNVGAVRKQFIGGTLLGVGVYWDYDGDLDQYPETVITGVGGTNVFPGGQVYNQVGVSGEWLTDYGNLRSNGYIPVGTTAQLMGPFVGNSILCVNGVNAALGGADLEVGAYVPGLADWAGMISVGGYALGNTRYQFADGAGAVPWFGGVYTRLDLTFIENWDFSLQYNNDSFFDSTGFARLTYRMGGSRRRNVPDQVEQPMMRNEHVVRARQTPVVAINPFTGQPWNVYHVDNTAAPGGNGTAEAPFTTLSAGSTAAAQPYDIVYVQVGASATAPYFTPVDGYRFAADNQFLVGAGSSLRIPTLSCGEFSLQGLDDPSLYPVISNPIGTAVVVDRPGTTVSHLRITDSPLGISDGGGIAAPGAALISDVIIARTGSSLQRGVLLANSSGRFTFDRLQLADLQDGLIASAANADLVIRNSTFTNVVDEAVLLSGADGGAAVSASTFRDVGTAIEARGANAEVGLTDSTIERTTGNALVASGAGAEINMARTRILSAGGSSLVASGTDATVTGSEIEIRGSGGSAVVLTGDGTLGAFTKALIAEAGGDGILVSGNDAGLYLMDESIVDKSGTNGLNVTGDNATVLVQDSSILNSSEDGVRVDLDGSSSSTQVTILRSTVARSGERGVYAFGVDGPSQVLQVFGSTISGARQGGVVVPQSNASIGRDPTRANGLNTSISNTGTYGVSASYTGNVKVQDVTISNTDLGIDANNPGGLGTLNLQAFNNKVTTTGSSAGITLTADAAAAPLSIIRGWIVRNSISSPVAGDIALTTVNPPAAPEAVPKVIFITDAGSAAALGSINNGATVVETPEPDPAADPPQPSLIQWIAPPPPAPPNLPVPTPP